MLRLDVGLTFPGTAEKAFEFYSSIFGTPMRDLIRYSDESLKDSGIPPADQDKLAYVMLKIGEDIVDADDTLAMNGPSPVPGTMLSIVIRSSDKAEATRVFHRLSEGGIVKLPIADQFWGAYYGTLRDKFGVDWAVRYDYPA